METIVTMNRAEELFPKGTSEYDTCYHWLCFHPGSEIVSDGKSIVAVRKVEYTPRGVVTRVVWDRAMEESRKQGEAMLTTPQGIYADFYKNLPWHIRVRGWFSRVWAAMIGRPDPVALALIAKLQADLALKEVIGPQGRRTGF